MIVLETLNSLEAVIELDNNCFFKTTNNLNILPLDIIDIKSLNLVKIIKMKNFLLKINFNTLNKSSYKNILRKLLFIKKIYTNKLGVTENSKKLLGYIINYNQNNKEQNDFILAINAIFYNTRYERYNYIYDTVCNYLDSYFYGKNLRDFKDNKCGEKRNTTSVTGCCHHYKSKFLGPLTKFVLCEYLGEDYSCTAKCISCKLFTCDYLEKKGIKFKIRDILLLNTFFNPLQKYFIKYMVFTPKEKILKRLMLL